MVLSLLTLELNTEIGLKEEAVICLAPSKLKGADWQCISVTSDSDTSMDMRCAATTPATGRAVAAQRGRVGKDEIK
jgi:hypothetical protein